MKTISRVFTFLVVMSTVACGGTPPELSGEIPAGPQTWIDAPLDGSTIPLSTYSLVAHASDRGSMSNFEFKVNGQIVNTDPVEAGQAGQSLVYITQDWLPSAPGSYLIEVRAANGNGQYGPSAFAHVTVQGPSAVSPVLTACTWMATINVFIREGPGASTYPEITAVEAGENFPVVGQSQDQQFWGLDLQAGKVGYVSKAERFGQTSGNCEVPVLQDPATPLPTNIPQAQQQCSDGIDNDGDGKIDYSSTAGVGDRQCTSPDDNDETQL
jgi:hypothetical protein